VKLAANAALAIGNGHRECPLFKAKPGEEEQLAERSKLKSQFLSEYVAELRTPLNAIIGFDGGCCMRTARTLKRAEEARNRWERVLRAAHHLLELINDILDLSKIEAGRMDMATSRPSPSPPPGRRRNLHASAPRGKETANEIIVHCPPDDRRDACRPDPNPPALLNLVSKRKQSSPKHWQRDGRCGTSHEQGQRRDLRWPVRDTGIGMSCEQMGRLFQEFVQADPSTTRRYGAPDGSRSRRVSARFETIKK